MENIHVVYAQLESALNEFFAPTTSNQRKREIEVILQSFQRDNCSLPFALSFIEHSKHQYVLMFSLHILQTTVNTRWLVLDDETRTSVKQTLIHLLPHSCEQLPQFLSSKMMKVFADIGRLEWPTRFPDFFDQTLTFISHEATRLFGLKLLKIVLEEFQSVQLNSDCLFLSFEHKTALKLHFRNQIPKICCVLLELVDDFIKLSLHFFKQTSMGSFFDIVRTNMSFASPSIPQYSTEQIEICAHILRCLSTLFQNLDVSFIFEAQPLVDFVFGVAYLGLNSIESDADSLELLALNCIEELFGRNFAINRQAEQLMFFEFLYFVSVELNNSVQNEKSISTLNEEYLKKYIEVMRLFFVHHIHRYDNSGKKPCAELLQQFLTFAENLKSLELFTLSMDALNLFIDYLSSKNESRSEEDRYNGLKYQPILEMAVSVLMNKTHVSDNDPFDSQPVIDFSEKFECSEWGQFLMICFDLLAKIAEFHSFFVFNALKSSLDAKVATYLKISNVSVLSKNGKGFYDDFQATIKAIGCLTHLFINENFWKFNDIAREIIETLCRVIVFSGQMKFYSNECLDHSTRITSVNTFSQLFLCMRSFCHWLAQFYADAQRTGENNEIVSAIISANVDCIVPLINESTPHFLLHSAVSTLHSFLLTVRPQQYFLNMNSVRLLYEEAHKLTFLRLPVDIYKVLYCSLVNYLILPWYNSTNCEQEWSFRKSLYTKLMKVLLGDCFELCSAVEMNEAIEFNNLRKYLDFGVPLVVEMVESIKNENSATKNFGYSCLKPILKGSLRMIHIYADRSDVSENLLILVCSFFESFIVQAGAEIAREAVATLLRMIQAQNVQYLKCESSRWFKMLELVLKILQSILKEMSKTFQEFTDSIVRLILDNIKPLICQSHSIELKTCFYEVLHTMVFVRWRYFFHSNILASVENNLDFVDKTQNSEQFVAVLQTFGESLSDCEPSIVKQNLFYLNNLNERWSLYERPVFVRRLYQNFCGTLLTFIIDRTHPILNEDFCETLAHMTCCSDETLVTFRADFLSKYLSSLEYLKPDQISELTHRFQIVKEIPSFSINVQQFCNDISVYKLCNQ